MQITPSRPPTTMTQGGCRSAKPAQWFRVPPSSPLLEPGSRPISSERAEVQKWHTPHQSRKRQLGFEENLGLGVITTRLGLSKGTASAWLREHPLPQEALREKQSARGTRTRGRRKVCKPISVREVSSRFRDTVQGRKYTTHQMGALAETAVLFRLYLHQFEVFRSAADGAKVDWVVVDPESGRTMKVQVKCVHKTKSGHGLPYVSLRCAEGTKNGTKPQKARRYREDEFDFIVGYDLLTDTCYVWTHEETAAHRAAITICEDAAERWDKFRGVAQLVEHVLGEHEAAGAGPVTPTILS